MSVPPIPKGYHSVTPYIICKNAGEAIEFYKKAFGAKEVMRLMGDNKVMHADIQIGNSHIMLADEFPEMGAISPESLGGTPVNLLLYVEDVDTFAQRAVAAGMKEVTPIQNQFYGDRSGCFVDPFGHRWSIASQVEELSQEELDKRFQKLVASKKPE